MRTRLAPTPSGYLHRGNCLNFLIVDRVASQLGLDITLRLDVDDPSRIRPAYIDDIHRVVGALGITVHRVFDPQQHRARRWQEMWQRLVAARDEGLVLYACRCSRRQGAQGHPCPCRSAHDIAPEYAVRIDAPRSGLPAECDAFVVWRQDGAPSGTLASLLDDEAMAITHIIRGDDLRGISTIQRSLAPFFKARHVQRAHMWFHPLLVMPDGTKLSKSAGSQAIPLELDPLTVEVLTEQAESYAASLIDESDENRVVKGISDRPRGLLEHHMDDTPG